MVIEKEFFEAIRNGDYDSMPKVLREIFILVVSNQDKTELIVNRYVRPTLLEDAIYKYNLQGITVTMITDVKKAAAIFTRFYTITIYVLVFLSNLSLFYRVSEEQLQKRYRNAGVTMEVVMKKLQGERRKNKTDEKESKDPREKEIILFIFDLKEEKKP
ncbi:MAG: hypothetical protein IJR05_01590 [Acidaminococcaceae bacterium]|nr:hypothetical protein [Acidaminococcaceae bacterium]